MLLLTATGAAAQAPPPIPPGPLSLEQVLELSEARSEGMMIARAGVQRSEGARVQARSGQLPQLSASASYDRALASEFSGVFGSSSGPTCPPFTPNPQGTIDARVAEIERAIDCGAIGASLFTSSSTDTNSLPFGRKNTWRATLTFSQNLYSGGRLGAQAAIAETGHQAAALSLNSTRAQLLFEVTQAYYDAALSDRLVTIAGASLQQAEATLRQTQAGLDAGTQPEFEVLRARVGRDNQMPILIRQRVNRDIAQLRLKRLLDLAPDYDLQLADVLGDDLAAPPKVFAERLIALERTLTVVEPEQQSPLTAVTLPSRSAVTEAEVALRQREASLRLTEAEKRPSVTLNSSYGRVGYPGGVFPTFDRTNWTVGASMQVPLLTGGRQKGDEIVARANVEEGKARVQQVQELADLDTRAAWAELIAARAAWEATAGTVQQANRAYEIADVRYRAGVSTQLELSDSRLVLQQAEANRAVAARDLQVARAHVALLPDLPIGAGTAGGGATPAQPASQPAPQTPSQPQPAAGGQIRNAATGQGVQSQAGTR